MSYLSSLEGSGIDKGLEQGWQEGRQAGLREAIAAVLGAKFGHAGKRLGRRARAIRQVKKLRKLLDTVLAADTLESIRDQLPSESR